MSNIVFKYGVVSSLYSCEAESKFTAYWAMVAQYNKSAHLIMLYKPKEIVKRDIWTAFDGKISARLDEIFASVGGFDKYPYCIMKLLTAKELIFISQINRDGSGTTPVPQHYIDAMQGDNTLMSKEKFSVHSLSITEGTHIAIGFNSFVVRLK